MTAGQGQQIVVNPDTPEVNVMFIRRLTFLLVLTLLVQPCASNSQPPTHNGEVPLIVSLSSNRTTAKMSDSIVLTIEVKNASNEPVFVYGTLRWGPSSSLVLFVADEKGKYVPANFMEDALPPTFSQETGPNSLS